MAISSLSLALLILPLLLPISTSDPVTSSSLTPLRGPAHDMLPQFGLPKGLLPDSVKSYSLSGDGEFEVELDSPCYVQFSDLVYYEKRIKGKLSLGSISELSGIQAKKLFVWIPVTGIIAHSAEKMIEFKVGFLSESLPAGQFEDIPSCKARASCRGSEFLSQAISEV